MLPEKGIINPSGLTKFRKKCLKDTDLLDLLINKTVAITVEKGITRSSSQYHVDNIVLEESYKGGGTSN